MTVTETEPEVATKRIYVGNLGTNVTTEDLVQLFGLGTTPFLKRTCTVELSTDERSGKSKNYGFVNVPEHVHSELMKLNGIEFYGRQLVIEEAKTKTDNGKLKEERMRNKNNTRGNGGRGRGIEGTHS